MQTITSYDELDRIRRELDEAAASGTLTPELLGSAIDTVDDAGFETIPSSVGMSWLWRNAEAFYDHIDDVLGFFRAHLDNRYITGVLHHRDLLGLIPEEERESFVREVLHRHDPSNNSWVEVLASVGFSSQVIADMVLEKLRRSEVQSGMYGFLQDDFLVYGAGRVERVGFFEDDLRWRSVEQHTLWSVLTDEQLAEAVRICIAKAPHLLFAGAHVNERVTLIQKLRIRLTDEQLEELMVEAAGKLESLGGVNLDELNRLSPTAQLEVARRLNGGSLDLVVRLALMMGYKGGRELCEEFPGRFEDGHSATNYRRLWSLIHKASDQDMAKHIERRLLKRLQADGYVLGQVTEGSYFDRKAKRNRPQMQVKHDGTTYVQDRSQHRYHAKAGDWVLLQPSRARRLTPRVVAVIFIPAHKDGHYA